MNRPKISIITPVKGELTPYQIANHISLTLQENQQWELIVVLYGDRSSELKNELIDSSKVVVIEDSCRTTASAINLDIM